MLNETYNFEGYDADINERHRKAQMIDNKERNVSNPHNTMLQDRSGSLHKVGSTMKGFSSKTLAAQLNNCSTL